MSIKTADCKKAIVNWIKAHPGHVSKQFDPPEQEGPAQLEKNWKRIYKQRANHPFNNCYERGFDCVPYDDQLRAYTIDDGEKIIHIIVQGE